ncbi:MAG: hypothetical protein KatS3mg022_1465 [Armatimonadota bacterium]|nr:MAG: hypothetical protein KatS3mg022_1465 [Armatimonadota bacterium]
MPEDYQETLARKLARWREARSIILSRFNHDVRAPLTAIVGFAELLGDEQLTPEQQVYVQRILEATDKIVAILDEVQKVLNEVEQEA